MRILDEIVGARRLILQDMMELKRRQEGLEQQLALEEECQLALQRLTELTEGRVTDLVASGLATVYTGDYAFRREGKKLLVDDGIVETEVMDGRGGGLSEFVALLLRIVALRQGKGGALMLLALDEPLKSLSETGVVRAARFLRLVADRMGVQLLMTTHRPELSEQADKVYRFRKVKGETRASLEGE